VIVHWALDSLLDLERLLLGHYCVILALKNQERSHNLSSFSYWRSLVIEFFYFSTTIGQ
jgi:hypothetical protein